MNIPTLNNDQKIPQIGYGTWQIARQDASQAIQNALSVGYRHIDGAMIYQNEEEVGQGIAASNVAREDIFVTTKLWNDDHGDVLGAFNTSLEKLNLDYVDMYLMHWPLESRIEAYKEMEKLLDSGRVKTIGVCNFTVRHLEDLLEKTSIVPAVNQVEFHPFLNQSELLDYCNSKGIVVEAYSPLVHGEKLEDPRIASIAEAYNKTPAQILLRWSVQKGMIPLPKSGNLDRMSQNLDIFDFQISIDDMQKIEDLNEGYRFCGDPTDLP